MKQRILVSLLVGGLVATMLPGLAAAAHKGDSVTGAGTTEGNPDHGDWLHFTVSAHSGPNGENPRGNIVYRFLNPDNVIQLDPEKVRSADVVCLHVDGNEAVVVAEFAKDALPAGPAYPYLALAVVDNGPPSGATPDRGFANGSTPFATCDEFASWPSAFTVPLVRGNVKVTDTQP